MKYLIDNNKADANIRDHCILHVETSFGKSASLEAVDCLVQHGKANVNATDKIKRTPLHKAVETRGDRLMDRLARCHNAEINKADSYGRTPIFRALEAYEMDFWVFDK